MRWALCLSSPSLRFPVKRMLVSAKNLRVLHNLEIATLEGGKTGGK
jgi:hypothetical protein